MSGALGWISDDPHSGAAKAAVREWLARARQLHLDCDVLGYAAFPEFVCEFERSADILDPIGRSQ